MIRCELGYVCAGEFTLSSEWVDANDDAAVLAAVRRLSELSNHPFLAKTSPGLTNGYESIEEFFEAFDASQVRSASAQQKRQLTEVRRREFRLRRAEIELALIHRDGYVCALGNCNATEGLTVDHVVPLSKGGTDDLENLRLLCRAHNSSKGDRDASQETHFK